MPVVIYPPAQQGVGSFDQGKFVEQRPIGFAGDRSAVERIGPLFYWAWGKANDIAEIGMHPHQAFEIMTYVLRGVVEHQDSLGTKQTVTAGGAQVMQAGTGIYHGEAFREVGSEGFQIWFEPNLRESVMQPPTYHQYNHEQFPVQVKDGVTHKTIIGEGSPIHIQTQTRVVDLIIQSNSTYSYTLEQGRALATLCIQGDGSLHTSSNANEQQFQLRDFIVTTAEQTEHLRIRSTSSESLRIVTIEVPTVVSYPLYIK
jgi:redox-sensitive bicupin YhaK (pirin superfamily)